MQMEQKGTDKIGKNLISRITHGKKMEVTSGRPGVRFYSPVIFIPV